MPTTRRGKENPSTPAKAKGQRKKRSKSSPPAAVPRTPIARTFDSDASVSSLEWEEREGYQSDNSSVATPLVKPRQTANSKSSARKKAPGSVASSTSRSRSLNPGRTNARGLAPALQKVLAEGIEAGGGRDVFFKKNQALGKFLVSQFDIFGDPNDKRYKQAKCKTVTWRNLTLDEYHACIKVLGVIPFEERPFASPTVESSRGRVNRKKTQAPITPKQLDYTTYRTPRPIIDSSPEATPEPAESIASSAMSSTMNRSTITVDINYPEKNREAIIIQQTRIKGVGDNQNEIFQGFSILTPLDLKWVLQDPKTKYYSAALTDKPNEILLKIPAFPFSLVHCRDKIMARTRLTADDPFIESLDNVNIQYADDNKNGLDRVFKELLLKFPNGMSLSTIEIHTKKDAVNLELQIVPAGDDKDKKGDYFARWDVVRKDVKGIKRGAVPDAQNTQSDAAALLGNLNLGLDGSSTGDVDMEDDASSQSSKLSKLSNEGGYDTDLSQQMVATAKGYGLSEAANALAQYIPASVRPGFSKQTREDRKSAFKARIVDKEEEAARKIRQEKSRRNRKVQQVRSQPRTRNNEAIEQLDADYKSMVDRANDLAKQGLISNDEVPKPTDALLASSLDKKREWLADANALLNNLAAQREAQRLDQVTQDVENGIREGQQLLHEMGANNSTPPPN